MNRSYLARVIGLLFCMVKTSLLAEPSTVQIRESSKDRAVTLQTQGDAGTVSYLRVIKRLKFVRRDEPFSPPVIEPAMPSLIHGGFWGSGLPAELLTNTYLEHLPFCRQRVLYLQRHGVDLSERTISAATDKVVDQLGFLLSRLKNDMLAGGRVRTRSVFICFLDLIHFGGSSREIVSRLVDSINKITKLVGFSKIVRCRCEASPNDDFTMQRFEMESANFYPNRTKIRRSSMIFLSMSRVTKSFFLQREDRLSVINQTAARGATITGLPRLWLGNY